MIKTVLFDVDGVLSAHEPFSKRLARDHGITTDITAPFFRGPFRDCLIGKADLKQLLPLYLPQWNWSGSVDAFINYWFTSENKSNQPLLRIVQHLRQHGITCYLATNQERYRTEYLLNEMGYAILFDGAFSSAYIGYMKPEIEFFHHILHKLEPIKAQEVLFWDDTPENVTGAREIGLRAEHYQNFDDFIYIMRTYFDGIAF